MKHFLSWPPKAVWPNARPHWAAKAKAVAAYRFEAKAKMLGAKPAPIRVTFCPKSRGPVPDDDNCIAAFKSARDGIADAMGINDREMIVKYEMGGRCKDGAVIVEVTA